MREAFAWHARIGMFPFPPMYMFGLCPLLLVQNTFRNPWSSLCIKIVFCYSKQAPLDLTWVYGSDVIHGGPLISGDRLATPKRSNMWLEGWNFHLYSTLEKRVGLEIEFSHVANDLISNAYVIKPHKNSVQQGLENFQVGELMGFQVSSRNFQVGELDSRRRGHGRKLVCPSRPHPMYLFHLAVPELYPL